MSGTVGLGTIAAQIAAKGFGALFGEILKQGIRKDDTKGESFLSGAKVQEYFRSTFDRCTKVKTLLNRDNPVDLLQTYVNVFFTSRSPKGEDEIVDDYGLIDRLSEERRIIIVGTAGGGKTVFMRYLWVSLFTNPEGRIPIYLELRRLNELTSIDLISFITHNCLDSKTEGAATQFKKLMSEGSVTFILDGFDEVSIEKRIAVERQIIELGRRHPKSTIVVSGRPDDKFDAWQEL